MTTHIHKSFTGLEVETGKQAEGGKLVYLASHSNSEPWLQPIKYPRAATETQRGKKKSNIRVDDDSKGCDGIMAS